MLTDIVFKYTRGQALEDGVILDEPLHQYTKALGIRWHTALTSSVLERCASNEEKNDLCCSIAKALRESIDARRLTHDDLRPGDRWKLPFPKFELHCVFSVEEIYPNTQQPCFTALLPWED